VSERRLYLIRHGRALARSSDEAVTPNGFADPPLDDLGREQAEILARRLRKMARPAAVYVSPLRRARQTIAPYEAAAGISATVVDDLREWFGGEWEFKDFEEMVLLHPEMPQRVLRQDPVFFLAPGGEAQDRFQERVIRAIDGIVDAHPEGDVWAVCHGGVINAYVAAVLGIRDQEMFFLPPNTSLNTIVVDGDRRHVWFLADDTHLTQPELFDDALHPAPEGSAYTPAAPTSEEGALRGRQVPLT
jgi:2,3-bisphosphoglycerate-dependent phosphoglycerate mutase